MSVLLNQQIDFYNENGYLVIENYATNSEINDLSNNAKKIIEEFDMEEVKIFTTDNQTDVLDKYFLESADKSSCFFEENAFDNDGNLSVDKILAINKIGHAMHDLDPECGRIAYKKELFDIMVSIGLTQPTIVQSQYIFKQPKIGAKVNPHTDSTFIYTEPLSCVAAWLAMEDATIENGCLCVIPGSHTSYPLQERFIKNNEGTKTHFIETSERRIVWDLDKLQQVPVKKGSLVLLHGKVVHASYANVSTKSRHAFVLHLVDKSAIWPTDNWLQRPNGFPFKDMGEIVNTEIN